MKDPSLATLALHPFVAKRARQIARTTKAPVTVSFEPSGAVIYFGTYDVRYGVIVNP